jgi:formylmethanofuran dehydrogenase subunit D
MPGILGIINMIRRFVLEKKFILITGRTTKQAIGMHKGKSSPEYKTAINRAEMNMEDMLKLGIADGQMVRLKNFDRAVDIPVFKAELPSGMIFMPMGPVANCLIPANTRGTGMPPYKEQMVEVIMI